MTEVIEKNIKDNLKNNSKRVSASEHMRTQERLRKQQQHIATRVCVETALELMKNGAESNLVVECCKRLGHAIGIEKVECLLTANAVMITTLNHNHSISTSRRCHSQGVNFNIVLQIQRLVIDVEENGGTPTEVEKRLHQIPQDRYSPLLTAFMVALSCACFAHLSGGDLVIMGVTFVASFIGIRVRQFLHHYNFNVFVMFIMSAFCITLVTSLAYRLHLGNNPHYAMASAVLLLVPGVPLVNAFSDILKGHTNMGIGRWINASLMALGACIGMVLAMSVMHINLLEAIYG